MSYEFTTGYLHAAYAGSLAEWGTPRLLPKSGAWILKRQVPGTCYIDGMGCYPLFTCRDWSYLSTELSNAEALVGDLVSLAVVTDPLGNYHVSYLQECFRDVVTPFKEHFVVDLSLGMSNFVSEHHRRYAFKALRSLTVERCENPKQFVNEWVHLYANLISRHNIRGIAAFSRTSLEKQLEVPGLVMFRATLGDQTVGMTLWFVQGSVAYYHLGAYSNLGYQLRASFALFWRIIETFAVHDGVHWLHLGAGAGIDNRGLDGLTRFKQGWATGSRTAYLCGRIYNNATYRDIMNVKQIAPNSYFPAYRKGEFG
jgi:hypothetical protein